MRLRGITRARYYYSAVCYNSKICNNTSVCERSMKLGTYVNINIRNKFFNRDTPKSHVVDDVITFNDVNIITEIQLVLYTNGKIIVSWFQKIIMSCLIKLMLKSYGSSKCTLWRHNFWEKFWILKNIKCYISLDGKFNPGSKW